MLTREGERTRGGWLLGGAAPTVSCCSDSTSTAFVDCISCCFWQAWRPTASGDWAPWQSKGQGLVYMSSKDCGTAAALLLLLLAGMATSCSRRLSSCGARASCVCVYVLRNRMSLLLLMLSGMVTSCRLRLSGCGARWLPTGATSSPSWTS
jgi:hypothetical protein